MYRVTAELETVLDKLAVHVSFFDSDFGDVYQSVMGLLDTSPVVKLALNRLRDLTETWLETTAADKRKQAAARAKRKAVARTNTENCRIFADGEVDELHVDGNAIAVSTGVLCYAVAYYDVVVCYD